MIKAAKSAKKFVQGEDFLQQKRYHEALACFEKCYELLGHKKSASPKFYDLDMMAAESAFAVQKQQFGLDKIETAMRKIQTHRQLNDVETDYIRMFCQILLSDYGLPSNVTEAEVKKFNSDSVHPTITQRFPIDRDKFRM